ncbi:MAG: TaqI-like C-terminal specificity domain-containing protein [Gaiellaceae bacterium]
MLQRAQQALRVDTAPASARFADPRVHGAVYTPRFLADWVAHEVLSILSTTDATVWDLACGEGALLAAVDRGSNQRHRLVGVDIDSDALHVARGEVPQARLLAADTLGGGSPDPVASLLAHLGTRPDAIILNPPWGARIEISPDSLRAAGYEVARGQFDSYDLFVELSLAVLRPGGVAGFILPDSLLNPEHLPLRRLLIERTLVLLARLGEGFFPSVYRGAMVVVIVNENPPRGHAVRCLRLTPRQRKLVLAATAQLSDIARAAHHVPQDWFRRTAGLRFELDVRSRERRILDHLEGADPMVWREWVTSSRGVELSKYGWVIACPQCDLARPLPRHTRLVQCARCSHTFVSSEAPRFSIVERTGNGSTPTGWYPLIVGEDVRRYAVEPSRRIQLDVAGISYKDPLAFQGPKLLVRKTGVGLTAAVDESGAYTTQVVFHFKPRDPAHTFLLDYLAGVLSSRLMLAYYLRTRGESQWRSHPYVTQKIIEELPIPAPIEGTRWRAQAEAISRAARARRDAGGTASELDLEVERLVCGLYRLEASDWRWALRVLHGAQALEGIKELRMRQDTVFSPLVVQS